MNSIEKIALAVEEGSEDEIVSLVQTALDAGDAPEDILSLGMIGAMRTLGDRFAAGDAFVPEMLMAARTMKAGVAVLKPRLLANAAGMSAGKVVIGTVQGDLHDIGKNLVAMMLESAGFAVDDLGADVPAAAFIERAATDGQVRIVALSTLLTTTMPAMRDPVTALNRLPNRGSFRVLVGGAPVTQAFAAAIGADG